MCEPPVRVTILVVENEDRYGVTKLLRKNGFHVVEAADGSAAIDLLHVNQNKIDAMLDVTIPRASSHEIVAEAAKILTDTIQR